MSHARVLPPSSTGASADLAPLSSSRVRWLESPMGRKMQMFFRMFNEWRPAAVLFMAMYNILVESRAAISDYYGRQKLDQYVMVDAANLTVFEARDTILDFNNPDGAWVTDSFSGYLNGGPWISVAVLALNTIVIALPFFTFRQPTFRDPESELTDTALCFHINIYNQKKALAYYKYAMIACVAIAVAVILATTSAPLARAVLEATYVPLVAAFASILFLFPHTKYNRMTYEQFSESYFADGQNARVDELPLITLATLLLYQGSKIRVLQEVSRQVQEDSLRAHK